MFDWTLVIWKTNICQNWIWLVEEIILGFPVSCKLLYLSLSPKEQSEEGSLLKSGTKNFTHPYKTGSLNPKTNPVRA